MRKVDQVEKEGVENEYGSDQVKEWILIFKCTDF